MESTTNSADFQPLYIITYALMAGLALFAAVVAYLVSSGSPVEPEAIISPQGDLLIGAGLALMFLTMSRFLSGKILRETPSEDRKAYPTAIGRYRTALIVRLALLEGAGLFAASFALITYNLNLAIISFFLVAIMWMARPAETEFNEWRG